MRAITLILLGGCTTAAPAQKPSESVAPAAPVATAASVAPAAQAYPPAPKADVREVRFGVDVSDPYSPLEDLNAADTRAWVAAENQLTADHLSRIPGRDVLRARLTALSVIPIVTPPVVRSGRYFWTESDGRQPQRVLVMARSLSETPTVVFDPNLLSRDGSQAFGRFAVNDQGTMVAWGLAKGGGDWQRWYLRDVARGKDLEEVLSDIKYYPPVFSPDGKGLYYSRFPTPAPGKELTETDHDCRVYYHRLGTPMSQDVVVFERPDHPTWQFEPSLSSDRRYLVLTIGDGQVGDRGEEQIAVLDLKRPGSKVVPLVDQFGAEFRPVGSDGSRLFFKTNVEAPKKKVSAIDVRTPERARWKTVIPEGEDPIDQVQLTGRRFFVVRMHDVHHVVGVHDLLGKHLGEVSLPGLGRVFGFMGRPEARETFFAFNSFIRPDTVYRYDVRTGASSVWKEPALPFSPDDFETRQVFFPAKDGTRIPIFISARRGSAPAGGRPTLLNAYGFGGVSLLPRFNSAMIGWMEQGGVFAVVNIRGGGEYGEAWHLAAKGPRRQVGWDDFASAAEWLQKNGVTPPGRLAIMGQSGGGMLVGGALTQHPELFGAAVPVAGVHDLLRFHLFGQGAGWSGDLGSPDNATDFPLLRGLSPLHNVRSGTRYPPTLIITSDHDVRVAPLHSFKFAAALQASQTGPAPILLQVETQTGHGLGSTLEQKAQQNADILAFVAESLGMSLAAPPVAAH